jgi:hypothetical protein
VGPHPHTTRHAERRAAKNTHSTHESNEWAHGLGAYIDSLA